MDRYEEGLKVRREVLGDEHVDRALENATEFTQPFQEYITRAAWGEAWTRPGLDRKTRSCITLAILTALRAENEIPMHVRAAIRNGLTPEEILEVLIHTAVYAGVPAANSAVAIAKKTLTTVNERGDHFVQSLERGLAVIRAFGPEDPELTLSDVARRTNLTRAAARRFLLTLVDLGYVRTDGKQFSLTPRVLDLGYAYLCSLSACRRSPSRTSSASPPRCTSPAASPCSTATRSSTSAASPRAASCACRSTSARASPPTRPRWAACCWRRSRRTSSTPTCSAPRSARSPRRRSRPRKQLAQELDTIRAQGWALVDQELEEGVRSVAAPIRGREGHVIAAVNVSAHASRVSKDVVRRQLLPPLLATAARIEADLRAPIMDGDGTVVRARA